MTGKPQTITNDLVDSLNEIRGEGRYLDPNSFRWRGLKRQAEQLLDADPAIGWETSGMVYSLAGEIEEADACFRRAYRLRPRAKVQVNWLSTMASLGCISAAHDIYKKIGPPPHDEFVNSYTTALNMGAFQMVDANFTAAKQKEIPLPEDGSVELAAECSEILQRAGLTDDVVARHLDVAGIVLREKGIFQVRQPAIYASDEEGGFTGITMVIHIAYDPAEIFALNKYLARKERELNFEKVPLFDVLFASHDE
jgi:tetratricopeptide (TPR) repeat protein